MNKKLPNPPVSRRLAGRVLRAFNCKKIRLTHMDEASLRETLTCPFVGDQLRRRLVRIWLEVGHECLLHEEATKANRIPADIEIDALLEE